MPDTIVLIAQCASVVVMTTILGVIVYSVVRIDSASHRCRRREAQEAALLVPGSQWRLRNFYPDDPFGCKSFPPVRITEVRAGWVRYDMGAPFPDERKPVMDFVRLYQLVPSKEGSHA